VWQEQIALQRTVAAVTQPVRTRAPWKRAWSAEDDVVVRAWHAGEIDVHTAAARCHCSKDKLYQRAARLGLPPRTARKRKITREQLLAEVEARTAARVIIEKYNIGSVVTLKVLAGRMGVSLAGLLSAHVDKRGRVLNEHEKSIMRMWARGDINGVTARARLGCAYDTFMRLAKGMGLQREKLTDVVYSAGCADAPPAADAPEQGHYRLSVNLLGPDPYLAALQRAHVFPRDDIYPGLKKPQRQWPRHLRAAS
jgi:hypothetical protein